MQIDLERSRQYLKQFQLQSLFVEELGWDNYAAPPLSLLIDGKAYTLNAVAEKRGQVVYTCLAEDGAIPASNIRTKIHKETSRYALENILVYVDQAQTEQVWQWVKRDPGKPKANRFHQFHKSQSGDALLQKLEALAVSFDDEEQLTLIDVTRRTRRAFDLDRVTKKFYERFKKEHGLFLQFIAGIHSQFDQEWYCSLMLNRLMFVYFVQKKSFLDGNTDYLRDRLQVCQKLQGQDSFHSFYRYFLLQLFHSGLGSPQRTPELEQLLGKVPYLNGGLFEVHQLEQTYPEIQIPDQAFEGIFDFFDEYQWHLDDRPLRNDQEINPDVLGYIFEKYINQKQMGAYYTKEDITEYISKNTILPFLLNAAEKACVIAFEPDSALWRLLKDNPDRYIYLAIQRGVDLPLPEAIAVGLPDVSQRQGWNRTADSDYALPTETWREHISRRQRCLDLRQKLSDGEVHSIDDLIALNLDIRQFAQDVIENCDGSELLRVFYNAICQVSILDPTCGSGAFLFAALNILEPLYDACLERMQVFLDDLKRSDHPHHPETFGDFRQILDRVAQHPNRRYFILKSIILNNLYGVDIMEEATEICKLRLFLKLVSQVERDPYAKNYGLEPLPDIDFNIRAGNTLVGFATYEEAGRAVEGDQQKKLDLFSDMDRIDRSANEADQSFQTFRQIQTEHSIDANQFREAKSQLRERLQELNKELNRYLAEAYKLGLSKNENNFGIWLINHQPFHWFVEFYGIMNQGGFDVIIGNPPWKEYAAVKKTQYSVLNYQSEKCGNLYGLCIERVLKLSSLNSFVSFIVQLPLVSSSRMIVVRDLLRKHSQFLSVIPFDDRPGKLFKDLEHCRSSIFIARSTNQIDEKTLNVTRYQRWNSQVRDFLFATMEYATITSKLIYPDQFPKYANQNQETLFHKLTGLAEISVGSLTCKSKTQNFIFYQEATQYWVKATTRLPHYAKNGIVGVPAHGRFLYFESEATAHSVCALLNSSLFYVYFIAYGDCFHLSDKLASGFPVVESVVRDETLIALNETLMNNLRMNADQKTIQTKDGEKIEYEEFYASHSKTVINQIDCVLAKHYGFTDEELDFIINYDIKYRMGRDTDDDE